MAENNEFTPVKPHRKLGKVKTAIVTGLIATSATSIGLGIKNLIDRDSGQPPYQTHSLQESAGINNWEQKVREQMKPGGEIKITDLIINVQDGGFNARYSPTVKNTEDGAPGNLAVEFGIGAQYQINNAIVIKGDSVDPNDPNGDLWAWVDGKYLGLENDIFISLGRQTNPFLIQQRPRTVSISTIDHDGNAVISDQGEVGIAPGDIVPLTPSGK